MHRAVGGLPARLTEALAQLLTAHEAAGGWSLVDGVAGRVVLPDLDLAVLFHAYRRSCALGVARRVEHGPLLSV